MKWRIVFLRRREILFWQLNLIRILSEEAQLKYMKLLQSRTHKSRVPVSNFTSGWTTDYPCKRQKQMDNKTCLTNLHWGSVDRLTTSTTCTTKRKYGPSSFSVSTSGPEKSIFRESDKRAQGAKYPWGLNHYWPETICIATYNYRTQSSQMKIIELEKETENIRWNIMRICEIGWKNEEILNLTSKNILNYKGTVTGKTSGIGYQGNKNGLQN